MSEFLSFESAEERALALLPLAVRMSLDAAGVKLSLAQWQALPLVVRDTLFRNGGSTADEYRSVILRAVAEHGGTPVALFTPPNHLEWEDLANVPASVLDGARQVNVAPPSLADWAALSSLRRFALVKLSRPGHVSSRLPFALADATR